MFEDLTPVIYYEVFFAPRLRRFIRFVVAILDSSFPVLASEADDSASPSISDLLLPVI